MKRILYNYPFLFVFTSIVTFVFYRMHNDIFWLFLGISLISLLRIRVFIISIIFVAILYFLHCNHYNTYTMKKTKGTFKGVVYDIRKNKHLTFYVKTKTANMYLFVSKIYDNINLYDKIIFKAKISDKINNPGFRQYLHSKNIYFIGYAGNIKKIGKSTILSAIEKIRHKIENEFYYFLQNKEFIFLQNAVFGDSINKSKLRDMFVNTQTAHIMSVSGLHMGFVFGIFYVLLYFLFANIEFMYSRFSLTSSASIAAFIPTVLYFFISGFHIPAIRSFLMVFVFIIALIYGYSKNSYNILFFIASILPLFFGYKTVLTPSFVMSFFMSFTAIYLYGLIKGMTSSKLIGYLIFSFLIGIFAMPVSAFYFHKVAYLSFLSNFIVVPYFGFIVLPLAFISIATSFIPIFLIKHTVFSILNSATFLLLKVVSCFSHIKPLNINIPIYIVLSAYAIMFFACELAKIHFIKKLKVNK